MPAKKKPSTMRKFNVLLEGPIGCGKTTALKTLEPTHNIFVIALEPGIENILGDTDKNKVHWAYVPPAKISLDELASISQQVAAGGIAAAQKASYNRQDYQQHIDVLETLDQLPCARCGKTFGPIEDLGTDWAVAIDGLTGLSTIAKHMAAGPKLVMSREEWQLGQNFIRELLGSLVSSLECTFILTAHVTKQLNEVTGMNTITISTLGKALAPELVKPWDEVVYADKKGEGEFFWSTIEPGVELKTRVLGWSDELEPDFGQFPWNA